MSVIAPEIRNSGNSRPNEYSTGKSLFFAPMDETDFKATCTGPDGATIVVPVKQAL